MRLSNSRIWIFSEVISDYILFCSASFGSSCNASFLASFFPSFFAVGLAGVVNLLAVDFPCLSLQMFPFRSVVALVFGDVDACQSSDVFSRESDVSLVIAFECRIHIIFGERILGVDDVEQLLERERIPFQFFFCYAAFNSIDGQGHYAEIPMAEFSIAKYLCLPPIVYGSVCLPAKLRLFV